MRIIAGLDSQDSGEIALVRGTRIGYLAQQNMVTSGESIWNELQSVYEPVFAMESILTKELNALRLNDALWQGFWSAKNRFLTQLVKAPLMASPSPAFVA